VVDKRFIIPIFISHLGCPHRCVYCNQDRIAHSVSALPTLLDVATEIEHYLGQSSRKRTSARRVQVAFYGGSFTALPLDAQERLLCAVKPFLDEGKIHSLRLSTRPDYISSEILEILKAHRVETVELGAQSMADEVLKISRRGYGRKRVQQAVRDLQREGFEVGVQLMIGLPGDSPERFAATIDEVIRLGPNFVRLYPTLVIKGTVLERWFRQGRYHPLSLDEAVALTKGALQKFYQAHIPVIRVGLQPTPSLEAPGIIVAGPYHPAFRQLAESALLYEQAVDLLTTIPHQGSTSLTFLISPRDISTFYGQGGHTIAKLREAFGLDEIRVRPNPQQKRGSLSLCV
jgi:histone acetyltransferase (RNA polymerase elongator complex component)